MVADHLAPKHIPKVAGREVFRIPAGTSALRKTVNCVVQFEPNAATTLSVPDALGALILKGAAYKEDSRDRGRHLDDAALLACAIDSPVFEAGRLEGNDRGRIRVLADQLRDPAHRSWLLLPRTLREQGWAALSVLARDPS
ncbi:hypothetical protein [Antrihabitans stalagmiti]|uniref:hypothetical protein n=1 Tax=Antrihabitans stalagmiti TaxID=2799499 RepID=UPI001F281B4C|nr:hypothetical protein [Antrihabitans stalagmiti]